MFTRWSAIATHLPKRTDNEIKNYWNTHLKKRLTKMGIDPVTHKPKTDALGSGSGNPKDVANLSHMAQWESARLEAEARLVRESKLVTNNNTQALPHHHQLGPANTTPAHHFINKAGGGAVAPPPCLDVLKAWQGAWTKSSNNNNRECNTLASMMAMDDLESPTSTLNFPDANHIFLSITQTTLGGLGSSSAHDHQTGVESLHQFAKTCESDDNVNGWKSCYNTTTTTTTTKVISDHDSNHMMAPPTPPEFKERMDTNNTMSLQDIAFACTDGGSWFVDSFRAAGNNNESLAPPPAPAGLLNIMEGFTDVFMYNSDEPNSVVVVGAGDNSNNGGGGSGDGSCGTSGSIFEENKSYWNSILNLVNTSPSRSPVF